MLTKLAIHAFKDEHLRKHVRDFKLQVNPEKVTRSFKNQYVDVEGVTGPVQIRQFAGIGQAVLNLEFVIDATGIVPGVDSVREKIRELRATACDFEGDTHTAPYLRVVWGDLNFPCRFDSMSIDYNLFSPQGAARARGAWCPTPPPRSPAASRDSADRSSGTCRRRRAGTRGRSRQERMRANPCSRM